MDDSDWRVDTQPLRAPVPRDFQMDASLQTPHQDRQHATSSDIYVAPVGLTVISAI